MVSSGFYTCVEIEVNGIYLTYIFLVSKDGTTKFEEDEYSRAILSEENIDTEPQKSMVLQFVLL